MSTIGHAAKTCQQCGNPFEQGIKTPSNFRKAKFCGMACMNAAKKHTPEQANAAFWSRVQKGEGCWIYTGAKLPKEIGGYGWVSYRGKRMGAHRLAWILTYGPIPPGLEVCHDCDIGPCCKPDHLFLGTHAENMADSKAKMRHTYGEKNKRGKLTEEQAKRILSLKPETVRGSTLPYELAAQHGVLVGSIWNIWRGTSWRHLQEKETTV